MLIPHVRSAAGRRSAATCPPAISVAPFGKNITSHLRNIYCRVLRT